MSQPTGDRQVAELGTRRILLGRMLLSSPARGEGLPAIPTTGDSTRRNIGGLTW